MNALTKIIAEKIRSEGPIDFSQFMSLALYHPEHGYYCSPRKKLGFDGDFYTSCTLTPVFGYAIARQVVEMWRLSGITDFTLVEYGAGTGELCASVHSFISQAEELPGKFQYYIIEISPTLRDIQKARVGDRVKWISAIGEIAGFTGAVISNELVDNFPVRRVVMQDQLMEVRVDYRDGFREVLFPASPELKKYFDDLRVKLPPGFKTEVCLYAEGWIASISKALRKGFVMTIDYGYLSGDLYASERSGGTIVSYLNHKVVEDLYSDVGLQDISCHVNFSALALFGMNNGLLLTGFREQGPFLRALGFEQMIRQERAPGDPVAAVMKENVLLQTILGEMGKKFKVLVQHKALPQLKLLGFNTAAV